MRSTSRSPTPLSAAALVLGAGLAAACGPSKEQVAAENRVRELESEAAEHARAQRALEDRLEAMRLDNETMAARLEVLGDDYRAAQGDRAALEASLEELREREREAQDRLQTFRRMIERFEGAIREGRLRVRVVRNRMVVELPEGVLFDSGRARLKPEGQSALREVASVLADIEGRDFQVAGHTDNVPIRSRFPSNWELSTARAVNVLQFLVQAGVPEDRLSAAGFADTQPITSNETAEGRALNRRIEIVLLPNLDELPDLSSLAETPATAPPPASPDPS